ncbi:MAG: nucleotidyltransferase domain-containing protein [Candidatus Bathyarchaeia archaeon]
MKMKERMGEQNRGGRLSLALIDEATRLAAVEMCKRLAERNGSKVVAACFYGSQVSGYARKDSDVDVLLVLEPYRDDVRYHYEPYEKGMFSVLAVDKELFERDVKDAYLGEFVAGRLLTPYQPMVSEEYLNEAEMAAKESIQGLISDYPGIWTEILISPVFFILDKMWRRARIYPPVRYSYVRMLEGNRREMNLKKISLGFERALSALIAEGILTYDGEYYKLTEKAGVQHGANRARVAEIAKSVKRAASAYVVHGYAGRGVNLLEVAQEFASKLTRELEGSNREKALEEPERYLFLPSERGLVSLSERMPIERLSERLGSPEAAKARTVERLGSAVNSVFLIRLTGDGEEKRVVAKKYRDWHGFKWFPLALWTVGVQRFALRGRSRMANEYAALLHLRRHGFAAPDVLDISWADKVLYREYVEGEDLEQLAVKAFSSSDALEQALPLFSAIGKTLAGIHATGIILGDPKPENILTDGRGQVFFLDLEQAGRGLQPTWDLAELLYYTSHLTLNARLAKGFAEAVLGGYLASGDRHVVKEIASPRFMRVFAVISAPHVLRAVSNVCKELGGGEP